MTERDALTKENDTAVIVGLHDVPLPTVRKCPVCGLSRCNTEVRGIVSDCSKIQHRVATYAVVVITAVGPDTVTEGMVYV